MNLFHSKKAVNPIVLFSVIITLIVFGFLSIFGYLFLDTLTQGFDDAGLYHGKLQEAGEGFLNGQRWFDYVIIIMVIVFIIGIGITSYNVASAPIFFIVMLFSGIFYGFVAYFFNYLFQQMISPDIFITTLQYFPNTILVCRNLHWIMLAEIIVGSIALYAKKPKGQFLA